MVSTGELTADDPDFLRGQLADERRHIRQAALAQIVQQPACELHEDVGRLLYDPEFPVRHLAAIALTRIGAPAVNELISALGPDFDIPVRIAAASGLGEIGESATQAVEQLGNCLRDPDHELRWHSALALSKIGEPAVPRLLRIFFRNDHEAKILAVKALGWIGPKAAASIDILKQLSQSGDPEMQTVAHSSLVKVTGDPATGLPFLLATAAHSDADVRKGAVEQIGELGPAGAGALGHLTNCLKDKSGEVACAAALAIGRMQPDDPAGIAALAINLDSPDPVLRSHLLMALASFGARAKTVLKPMREREFDSDAAVAATAKAAIAMVDTSS